MKDGFSVIEDSLVVLRNKGVYRQAQAYRRAGSDNIYVNWGSGFIRLGGQNMTTVANVVYESLDLPFATIKGKFGEPLLPSGPTGVVGQVSA